MSDDTIKYLREQYVNEVKNISMSTFSQMDSESLMKIRTQGHFWELIDSLDLTLAVSREYEHFITLLSSNKGDPCVSGLEIPHPSGMYFDRSSGDLIVSSTRTPNQLFWFRELQESDYHSDIIPEHFEKPVGKMFIPYRSVLLPGSLYIHDVAMISGQLYVTATGHNFLARIGNDGGWERVWWPKSLDGMGRSAFNQNYFQLNSIAVGESPESSYFTAFSDVASGVKPWKAGYGPRGRGVVFDGASREVMLRGLTCPHSAKLYKNALWLCNSGYGEIGKVVSRGGESSFESMISLNGFTRGLAFHNNYAFVGLSKVIETYEPYAPGLNAKKSVCGIVVIDMNSGKQVASLEWCVGYQIYDIQIMPGVRKALLPNKMDDSGEFNKVLRFLG